MKKKRAKRRGDPFNFAMGLLGGDGRFVPIEVEDEEVLRDFDTRYEMRAGLKADPKTRTIEARTVLAFRQPEKERE